MIQEKINAQYEDHMGNDLTVCNAARQSFNKQKSEKDFMVDGDINLINFLATGMRTKEWDAFLDQMIQLGINAQGQTSSGAGREALKEALLAYKRKAQHWAPFAHPHLRIRMRLPIFLARQFVKHQIGGTWSEESRRYMSDEPSFYFEPVLHMRPDDIKQGADGVHPNTNNLRSDMEDLTYSALNMYAHLIKQGVAPEEARQILTQNAMTGVTWTGSLLFWARLCTQRVDSHAQLAAQHLARQIDAIARPLYPVSWQALVGNLPA